jgi:hypothetical protein
MTEAAVGTVLVNGTDQEVHPRLSVSLAKKPL